MALAVCPASKRQLPDPSGPKPVLAQIPVGDRKARTERLVGQTAVDPEHAYSVNLLAHWQMGEDEPWFLATNLPTQRAALQAYRRMWIEGTFGDLKDNGFDLESTCLHTVQRLNRLTLAVVLLYLDLLTCGVKGIKGGLRRLVDRNDRRDLSIFRIGLYLRERHLANSQPFSIGFIPIL
jgi:hypothetical protein